MMSKGYVSVEA